mgnify:CR=1 FL=1
MSKYRYRPERTNDPRLTWQMVEAVRDHAQEQIEADCIDFGFSRAPVLSRHTVRVVLEAAMIECPELFVTREDGDEQ